MSISLNNNSKKSYKKFKISKSFFVKPELKHVLLIDDDPSFRALVKSVVEKNNVKITVLNSLRDLPSPRDLIKFDLLILDYYMDRFDGLKVARYVDTFFPYIPIILISSSHLDFDDSWPRSIKKFIGKESGVYSLVHHVQKFLIRNS